MTLPERITLVLRPAEGGTLEHVLPFAKLGAHVYIGRGLAVIAGMSEGDLQATLEEQQAVTQPAAADKSTVNQGANFGENVNQHQDDLEPDLVAIIAALEQKISLMEAPFDIDEHVKLAADARRYRWLRDRDCIEDPDEDLLVLRGGTYFTGDELDRELDTALRLEALGQQAVQDMQEQQP
ncbi:MULTISPECIES: hypothetical protein [unclassified Pseudomonas]|uniref:hypothetical protein n=1 Tax=unclassified Pseudomonas TaxID=196821 RepID=UPI002096FC64|nr:MULTISPECIES: hypothetical protein [unclassified Pseudomonas]MCO7519408.1 hypothetical protein [Pseudomonas sp. 1]MCO7541814.1 hypothetical protein [Pseudomonas sp. VA159-2]